MKQKKEVLLNKKHVFQHPPFLPLDSGWVPDNEAHPPRPKREVSKFPLPPPGNSTDVVDKK